MSLRNIKLTLSYDGSRYHGWQFQPDRQTIQERLETAIGRITGVPSRVAGAGRTDAGVHALGQVASFKTESRIPAKRFRPALQSQLPEDIVIRHSEEVPLEFHAGYAALWKQYRYVIWNSEIAAPHLHGHVTRIVNPLSIEAMQKAAQTLMGKHDFRSFESQFPNKATSVRTVHYCHVREANPWEVWTPGLHLPAAQAESSSAVELGSASGKLFETAAWQSSQPEWTSLSAARFLYLDIVADGFLYNMVRAIMGTLIKIGEGSWPSTAAREILEAQDRRLAGPTAPAAGLYLMHVEYHSPFPGCS